MRDLRLSRMVFMATLALLVGSTCEVSFVYAQQLRELKLFEGGTESVVLVVNAALANKISLDQFAKDLGKQGYTVYEKPFGLTKLPELAIETQSLVTTPPAIRSYLAGLYHRTRGHLVGAILIGDLPHAYQFVTLVSSNPKIPSLSEEVISFQYYADLDGIFESSPGYKSPGNRPFSYDVHSGSMDWEIWIGVLPPYKGDLTRTAKAINEYFAKNHAYREGKGNLPRSFLEVNEFYKPTNLEEHNFFLHSLGDGPVAWTPFSNAPSALLYFDSPLWKQTVDQGYSDLSAGVADFTVVDAHGSWLSSGKLDIGWVEKNWIRTFFYWSNGCATGDLDHPVNFLTAVLYSPTSMVLVAKGTTNNSGGMGTNKNGFFGHNIAATLSTGRSFGQAIINHVNVPLLNGFAESREFHFGTAVVLGDPTLQLRLKE